MKNNKLRVFASAVLLMFSPLVVADDDDDDDDDGGGTYCETQALQGLFETAVTGSEISGRGKICVGPKGVTGKMKVRGLQEGWPYTVWWVYIDQPGECLGAAVPFPGEPVGYAGPCGFFDFFQPMKSRAGGPGEPPTVDYLDPLVVFGRMDSYIPDGKWTRFRGDIRSFEPSPGGQIWMLIFGHFPGGLEDGRNRARKLLTPEDPGSGAPHVGVNDGVQKSFPSSVVVIQLPE